MTYDHSKKAGNFGDVWKHAVLVSLARRLPEAARFRYAESHSGGPCHRLQQSGEWQSGIGKVLARGDDGEHPYLGVARQHVDKLRYPAGWVFFACALAPRVTRLSVNLCDLSSDVAGQYSSLPAHLYPDNVSVEFSRVDGYSHLEGVEVDLVFLDPPFHPDADADWNAVGNTCLKLRQRGVPFLAWYPFYWPSRPRDLVEATSESGWEVAWAASGEKPSQNLKGCGVLVSSSLVPTLESARQELQNIARRMNGTGTILVRSPGAG